MKILRIFKAAATGLGASLGIAMAVGSGELLTPKFIAATATGAIIGSAAFDTVLHYLNTPNDIRQAPEFMGQSCMAMLGTIPFGMNVTY